MKIVYLGTPDFAVAPLEEIVKAGYEVVAVVTQPDKPVGRKQILTPSAVKECALKLGIKVLQYDKIRLQGVEDLKNLNPDLMVTCAYGQILSQEILDIPKLGTINIHASLLPKLRGSSPIQWSIINGDTKTGITIMMTDIGIDTGDIILQDEVDILPDETGGELFDKLSLLGASAVVKALDLFKNNKVIRTPQDHSKATHTKMLKKESGKIDFSKHSNDVHNLIRGLNPWPVAYFSINGEVIKVYKSQPIADDYGDFGHVFTKGKELVISCGKGAIKLLEVQRAGSKRMPTSVFLNCFKIEEGIKVDD
jgi:methionyl-tRNA formyltransferase